MFSHPTICLFSPLTVGQIFNLRHNYGPQYLHSRPIISRVIFIFKIIIWVVRLQVEVQSDDEICFEIWKNIRNRVEAFRKRNKEHSKVVGEC